MNWLDFIIIVIVGLGAWGGYRKGFLAAFAKLASYILGFVGAVVYYKPFAEYLSGMPALKAGVIHLVEKVVTLPGELQIVPIQSLALNKVQSVLNSMSLPDMYKEQVGEMLQQLGVIAKHSEVFTVSDAVHQLIAGVVIKIIAFILLVIAIEVVTYLFFKLLSKATNQTPAGFFNKGAGLILGSARSFLIVMITIVVASPVLSLGTFNKAGFLGLLSTGIQGSLLGKSILTLVQGISIIG
ncbi:MAG: CvpA family protein [Carboxydocellales bacterium]